MSGQTQRFNRRLVYGRGDDKPVIALIIRDFIQRAATTARRNIRNQVLSDYRRVD